MATCIATTEATMHNINQPLLADSNDIVQQFVQCKTPEQIAEFWQLVHDTNVYYDEVYYVLNPDAPLSVLDGGKELTQHDLFTMQITECMFMNGKGNALASISSAN